MRERAVASLIAICSALALVLAAPASATEGPANATLFYPCSTCHEALRLPGVTKVSPAHLKNLTLGRHSGLYCSTCHSPEDGMMKLVGGIEIAIPGLHPRSKLMEVNRLCATCHADVYADYQVFAHGNATSGCEGEELLVRGYKGVSYVLRFCPTYEELEVEHARSCVECHDPHDPVMPPPSILERQSYRPEPPEQTAVARGGLAVLLAGASLIAAAAALHRKGERGLTS